MNKEAQDGKSPKWQPRSRCGIYLGHSPTHAGSVAMVLNPETLHNSPQYHVAFMTVFPHFLQWQGGKDLQTGWT